jgi:hypothetical protein
MSAAAPLQDSAQAPARPVAPGRRPGIRAEEELLLLTAGGSENDTAIHEVASGEVDWKRFLALSQLERAVPVVYARLKSVAANAVPADVLDQMRRLAMVNDFSMLHLESRLRESLQAMDSVGVRVMLLKGAALAHTVYGGVRQRPMSDLDLLVDPSNASLARRTMLDTGWRDMVGGIPDHVYERHHHLPPMEDARRPELQLEIHTGLFPERQPFAFEMRELWAKARALGAPHPNAFVPDPVYSLLHVCLHFLWSHQGRFGVWRAIRDLDAIARSGALDWASFVDVARATRGVTSCYWTLRIAAVTSNVVAPPDVLAALRPPRSNYVLDAIERHFVRNLFPVDVVCPSVTLDHALWELAVMPRWSRHGDIRPWDEEAEFVVPSREPRSTSATLPAAHRVRRLLASPAYIRSLLRPQP